MILSEKDLQLLSSMSSQNITSEADSSFKDNELKIEFDGTTVLCRVCGDKASGFHYGVHSCEGCKGFFRRSIQQKIQYRPCTKNQQCSILRINRNRCQYCRLKKCISVGMSRDAVRFGRVPKREKAKILAAMQKVNQNSQEKYLNEQLEDESKLLISILQAHEETCDYTRDKVATLIEKAHKQPIYARCPLQMACPLNPLPQNCLENGEANGFLEDFSERFSPAIRGVVEFAKRIPGFGMLSQDDQVTLLKAGVFEVLLVRLACMFDKHTNSMICLNGMILKRESLHSQSSARFLLDSMFGFAEMLNALNLSDHEIALFCAVVVISPDRPGLRNTDLVQKIHRKLDDLLQKAIVSNHSDKPGLFADLKKKIPDLRTLNTLHAEKLLAYKMGPNNGQNCVNGIDAVSSNVDQNSSSSQNMCSYASLLPVKWQQFALNDSNNVRSNSSREANSSKGLKSEWNHPKDDCEAKLDSPRCFGNSVSSTNNLFNRKSPPRSASVSSAKSNGYNSDINSYSPSDQVNNFILGKRLLNPIQHNSRLSNINGLTNNVASSNGLTELKCEDRSLICNEENYFSAENSLKKTISGTSDASFNKLRRVDSPTDSGIESGKEQCNGSTPTTSVCSSPRSAMDDKVKDIISYSEGCERQETIDDMPMLKRALQAPPLINTNMLMDEAYRHHKKFRATKREFEPGSTSSTLVNGTSPPPPRPSSATPLILSKSNSCAADSLASTHSTLVRVLEQAPRYVDEHQNPYHHQLKRTDLSQNIILKSEPMPPPLDLSRKRDLLFL